MIGVWGTNGFIGRHLTKRLVSAGKSPVLFARDFEDLPFDLPPSVTTVKGDFETPLTTIDRLRECRTIVLLVNTGQVRDDPTNTSKPYESLLRALVDEPGAINHVVYMSSGGAVYGPSPTEDLLKETHPARPISSYGQGKLVIEGLVQQYAQDADWKYSILRPSNPIGPWSKKPSMIDRLITAADTGAPVSVFGDGTMVRDYFDVAELAEAIRLCADRKGRNQIYNLGSGVGHSINEVIEIMEHVSRRKIVVDHRPANPIEVPFNVLDCGKIKNELGWDADSDLYGIVKKMWDAHENTHHRGRGVHRLSRLPVPDPEHH